MNTRSVQRVRHDLRLRLLTVKRVTRLTPSMVRITLTGDDLHGFTSAAADDHMKVFFPAPGTTKPIMPKGPPGTPTDGPAPIARDYTPRRYDAALNELDIDFVLHGEGPATTWAAQASVGQQLGVGGPRGSFVVNGVFDWYLLIADESGLPALARRLEELPGQTHAFAIVEVADAAGEQKLSSAAQVTWVHRHAHAQPLQQAVSNWSPPAGAGYIWIAGESQVARTLRNDLITRGFDKQWLKAAGYWKHGAIAMHDKLED